MYSWLELAALVVRHAGVSLALLSTDVVSELSSTEQTKEDGSEIEREELHDQYPIHLQSSTASNALSPRSAYASAQVRPCSLRKRSAPLRVSWPYSAAASSVVMVW